jgi:hypothetical protein
MNMLALRLYANCATIRHKTRMAKPLPLWSRRFENSSNIYPEVESALSAAAGIALTTRKIGHG